MTQTPFLHPFVTRSHRGIYGIIRRDNQILLIRKARGPYTGLYDLPGGSPEAGETPEQTVIREIKEETNCDVISHTLVGEKTIFFSAFTKASGEEGCLQHTGVLFNIEVSMFSSSAIYSLNSLAYIKILISEISSGKFEASD